ncbi:MAG: PTS glucose transporter subunit IIA [Tessaracoccus sp.]|uniref:glucose PTS transporter subunit IIA n=1 Tax=Tessaracoccus sp. TaxID=1971211 RepID=UPI001ED2E312|nr:glucose PTS transporter subunit IIA [Tessaracoccus sp.]MBK7819796.1 PTS glucose transporter subunit IIA [Tessaracoccus sp.]
MSDYTALAQEVAKLVGGPDNVTRAGNCATRLRLSVADPSKVDLDALNATPGVLKAVHAGGQLQVVIGTHVADVLAEIVKQPGWSQMGGGAAAEAPKEKRRPIDVVFDFLGGTFQPLIPAITGAAMVQIITLLLTQFGGLNPESPTALILNASGNAIFYFLPIFVAYSASSKLGTNPFTGAIIAAALLHPSFTAIGQTGDVLQAFGMPLFMYTYANSMFPALMVALALAALDRLLKKVLPKMLQQVFNPTIEVLLLVPLTALVFGPVGVVVGNGIGSGVSWLSATAPWLFYVIVPALWVFLVALGIHWALISIGIADLAATGSSVMFGAAMGYQYAIMGIAVAVLIRAARDRKKEARDTAAAATLSVAIGGITEPTVYGFVLRYRKVLWIQMATAGVTGAVMGIFGQSMVGFSPSPFLSLPIMDPVIGGILGIVTSLVVAIVLVWVFGYENKASDDAAAVPAAAPTTEAAVGGFTGGTDAEVTPGDIVIAAPLAGKVVPLSETGDPVFGGGLVGPGVAIVPSGSRVVAPAAGVVVALPDSHHAIGLRLDSGVELLVHVGIDTVRLKGTHFTPLVHPNQRVTAGEVLLEFDPAGISAAGYPLITPVVVTNALQGQEVVEVGSGEVGEGAALLDVRTTAPAASE